MTTQVQTTQQKDEPKIYVACLSSYNSGYLHGSWIVPKTDAEELQAQIDEVLKTSPVADAEEWAIHDYDNFPNLGEYPDLDKIIEVQEAINEHDIDKVNGFLELWSIDDLSHIDDAFYGEYGSFKEFAETFADETIEGLSDGNSTLARYFDYDAFERDLNYDFNETDASGGNVYIWNANW
jgi:antirestriction protein